VLIPAGLACKSPGQIFSFTFEVANLEPLGLGADRIVLAQPVAVAGTYVADAEGISVRGELQTAFRTECARCLKLLEEPICSAFDVRFHKTSDDDEVYLYEGDFLDLTNMLRDHVLLAIPMKSVCSLSCKGLCQTCGANLNEGDCGCNVQE